MMFIAIKQECLLSNVNRNIFQSRIKPILIANIPGITKHRVKFGAAQLRHLFILPTKIAMPVHTSRETYTYTSYT